VKLKARERCRGERVDWTTVAAHSCEMSIPYVAACYGSRNRVRERDYFQSAIEANSLTRRALDLTFTKTRAQRQRATANANGHHTAQNPGGRVVTAVRRSVCSSEKRSRRGLQARPDAAWSTAAQKQPVCAVAPRMVYCTHQLLSAESLCCKLSTRLSLADGHGSRRHGCTTVAARAHRRAHCAGVLLLVEEQRLGALQRAPEHVGHIHRVLTMLSLVSCAQASRTMNIAHSSGLWQRGWRYQHALCTRYAPDVLWPCVRRARARAARSPRRPSLRLSCVRECVERRCRH
jgi:hypothetical protein